MRKKYKNLNKKIKSKNNDRYTELSSNKNIEMNINDKLNDNLNNLEQRNTISDFSNFL